MKSLIKSFAILILTIVGMGNVWAATTLEHLSTYNGPCQISTSAITNVTVGNFVCRINGGNAQFGTDASATDLGIGSTYNDHYYTLAVNVPADGTYTFLVNAGTKSSDTPQLSILSTSASEIASTDEGVDYTETTEKQNIFYNNWTNYYCNIFHVNLKSGLNYVKILFNSTSSYVGNIGSIKIATPAAALNIDGDDQVMNKPYIVSVTGMTQNAEAEGINIGNTYDGVMSILVNANIPGTYKVTANLSNGYNADGKAGFRAYNAAYTTPDPSIMQIVAQNGWNVFAEHTWNVSLQKGINILALISDKGTKYAFNSNSIKVELVSGSVALGSTGFSTLSTTKAFSVSGATAYKAAVDNDEVVLTPIEGNIPANEGVVLYGTADATATITAVESATAIEDNALKAVTTTDALAEGTNYVLATKEGETAFVKYTGSAEKIMNKAYLNIPAQQQAKSLGISFNNGEVTGIENVTAKESLPTIHKVLRNGHIIFVKADGTVYSLSGTRMK